MYWYSGRLVLEIDNLQHKVAWKGPKCRNRHLASEHARVGRIFEMRFLAAALFRWERFATVTQFSLNVK